MECTNSIHFNGKREEKGSQSVLFVLKNEIYCQLPSFVLKEHFMMIISFSASLITASKDFPHLSLENTHLYLPVYTNLYTFNEVSPIRTYRYV